MLYEASVIRTGHGDGRLLELSLLLGAEERFMMHFGKDGVLLIPRPSVVSWAEIFLGKASKDSEALSSKWSAMVRSLPENLSFRNVESFTTLRK